MDPLTALKAIEQGLAADNRESGDFWQARKLLDAAGIYNENLSGTRVLLELARAALTHVSPPSADARAKLEQAHARWVRANRAWDDRGQFVGPDRSNSTFSAAFKELREAEAALLTLPPHEGETPQPAAETLATFAERRKAYHMTFNGGWHHSEDGMKAFHHGMDTVFNGLDAAVKGERDQSGHAWLAPLPPVVQTRPEEPR